jgi:uncharacterized protein
MAEFRITALDGAGREVVYRYDNQTSKLTDDSGVPVNLDSLGGYETKDFEVAGRTSPANPHGKTPGAIKKLKIQLGLSCNYECGYCSQRFVPHADETSRKHVEPFLTNLSSWFDGGEDGRGQGVEFQFWGGEPFVYWKTLKPLAEALMERYPNATVWFPTNGSLLDKEKNDWIERMGFAISISHDGPGQWVRGPDPLDDPKSREAILDLFNRLHPKGKISFNACINKHNTSRAKIIQFFKELTGRNDVQIGEGAFVDAYDEGGLEMSIDKSAMAAYSRQSFAEIRDGSADGRNFRLLFQKITSFIRTIRMRRPASAIGQKCSMDRPDNIAVDLRGNVLTCQNVSAASLAPNGQSHKIGHVDDFDGIKLKTAAHWSHREDCARCPLLQLCAGSCMFLEGDLWERSCDNAFADNVPFFAAAFEIMTGCVPVSITGGREDRTNLWIDQAEFKVEKRRVIPIVAR